MNVDRARPGATGTVALGALTWAHFLNDGYVNYLPGVLPAVLASFGIPLALVGSLVLTLQLAQFLQPVMGWLADRAGGRLFITAGLAMSTLGASLVGAAPGYAALLGLLLLASLGSTTFHPQAMSAARSLARRSHGLTMAVFLVGGELGRGVWPTVAGALVTWLGIRALGWLALPGILTVLLLPRAIPRLSPRPAAAVRIRARDRGAVAALVAFVTLRNMLALGVVTFVPLIWHARGGSLIGGASLVTVMLVVGIAGNLSGGSMAESVGRRSVLVGSTVLSALLLFAFLLAHGAWLWITLGLMGVAVFAASPVTVLIGQDLFPDSRSLGSGVALGVGTSLGALGVFGLGFVAASHGLEAPLWVLLALTVASLVPAAAAPGETGR